MIPFYAHDAHENHQWLVDRRLPTIIHVHRGRQILTAEENEQIIHIANLGVEKVLHRLTAEFMIIKIMERSRLPDAMFLAQQTKDFFMLVDDYTDYERAKAYLYEIQMQDLRM